MERAELYRDIASRTQGDIYIGVVGPVRTGKSTFIKRFMDELVIPRIENEFVKERVIDELPQSGSGKTVMTTQPKFVPNDAVTVRFGDDNTELSVRMIDCVGFMAEGALGANEEDVPRMVRTPWFDHDIPFDEAAELGTSKVITEHSTVGVVVLADESITGISRSAYSSAEEKVFSELRSTGKPFAVVLNTKYPNSDETRETAREIAEKHSVDVIPMDVINMNQEDIFGKLENLLMGFPIRAIKIGVPKWLRLLPAEHDLIAPVIERIRSAIPRADVMRDQKYISEALSGIKDYKELTCVKTELGNGEIAYKLEPEDGVFYRLLSEESGYEIKDEYDLFSSFKGIADSRAEYERVAPALKSAAEYGYGIVYPKPDELALDKPEIVHHGNRVGVKLKARSSGLHIIRVDIESEVNPIVGTAEQGEELAKYLMDTFEKEPEELWSTNIFGKPIYDLVKEGLSGKVDSLPQDVEMRFKDTLNRMVNEGCKGLVCIML